MVAKIGGSMVALLGLGCLCFGLFDVSQEVLLAMTGHSTSGEVIEKYISTDQDNTSYYLSYRYGDDTGHTYTATSDVSHGTYDGSMLGAPIPVVYSSTSPTTSRVRAAGAGLLPGGMFAIMGGGALWFGLQMLLRQIHWEKKLARLMANGERRSGRLVAMEEDKTAGTEDTRYVLKYAFVDETGQERIGNSSRVKPSDHDFWKGRIGFPMDVRVNPADPEDHIALVEESKHMG